MSSVFSEDNEVLQKRWKQHNPEDEQYLEKEKVIEWIKIVLKQTNTLQNFQSSMTDLEGLIKQYLSQVHQVTQDNAHNLSLSYSQGVDFLRWLTNTGRQEKEEEFVNREGQKEEVPELKQEEEKEELERSEEGGNAPQTFHQQNIQQEQVEEKEENVGLQEREVEKNQSLSKENELNYKKMRTERPSNDIVDDENNENLTSNPNEFNLEQISRKYKDYLRVIFDHYCKASYATGQDPTFQQIMHKTTIMTINKFMMFSKDFEIARTHPSINRNYLIQTFKKNSECYKQMSFEQFVEVFRKLSMVGLQQKPAQDNDNSQNQQKTISSQMVKLLQFCEISTSKKFRQKMKRLNIQYRAGPKTNAQLKVVPQGYRFKFTSNNGKSQEQIKQQLNERKIHRSERKIFLRQKINLNQNDLSLNKKASEVRKKQLNLSKQVRGLTREQPNQTQSTNIVNKILTPVIPPAKRNPQPPPLPPRSNNTPVQNHSGNSSTANNVFKKQLGYAELHKIKHSEGYSRKRVNTNTNNRSGDGKTNFKLNSIVEQARMEMMEIPPTQGHSEHLTESIATNSREQTNRMKMYDINKINNKMQEINDKIKRDRQIQEELTGLLDMDNDEQDQYLVQHLQREKKNESIVKRLSHKINQLQMKR